MRLLNPRTRMGCDVAVRRRWHPVVVSIHAPVWGTTSASWRSGYLSQRSVLDAGTFYDRYVNDDFEQQFVPHAFEEVCKQYLVRQNRAGNIEPPFDLIGAYSYDDPATRTNREFDVVTRDLLGYAFYEAKFRSTPVTQRMIDEEIEQVQQTGLACHRYGFFSRSGFETLPDGRTELIGLEEMYE